MKLVLRAVLSVCELRAGGDPPETTRRRGITFSPSRGSRVILELRDAGEIGPQQLGSGVALAA